MDFLKKYFSKVILLSLILIFKAVNGDNPNSYMRREHSLTKPFLGKQLLVDSAIRRLIFDLSSFAFCFVIFPEKILFKLHKISQFYRCWDDGCLLGLLWISYVHVKLRQVILKLFAFRKIPRNPNCGSLIIHQIIKKLAGLQLIYVSMNKHV